LTSSGTHPAIEPAECPGLLECLAAVPDPRSPRGVRHALVHVLALAAAAVLAGATSLAVPLAGIAGALVSIGGLVAIAGRRASLTVTLLAGLALASFAGAMTALILNLAPNPFAALEIAFWLLGSLEDRSSDHLLIAAPFFAVSWAYVKGCDRL